MLFRKTNGFTLVELLVVISILGILAAALTMQVTKARSIGQSMRCKANLHNLAQAALNYGVDHARLPFAGSYERCWPTVDNSGKYVVTYHECQGWVSWTGSGRWTSRDMQSSQMKKASYYGDTAYLSITNGVLWSYVGKDLNAYVCDVHKSVAKRQGLQKVLRSYVMNGYFGFDHKTSPTPANMPVWREIPLDSLSSQGNAGNLLLFAELPAFSGSTHTEKVAKDEFKVGSDGVLETDIRGYKCTQTEVLGFNHQVAKKYVAHAAFADGHVDVLIEPQGTSDADLRELAKQLCNGDELSQTLRDKMR
jgi:prepilin-type N-terminal cleavage/methylation domain-containing protein/prepilin-type processing-associated H-X9-DG protein